MKILLLPLLFLVGCSTYSVQHQETNPDGTTYKTVLRESVPPGGKKISNGTAHIGVEGDGSWGIDLGAKTDSDATGTAALIQGMAETFYKLGFEAGQKAIAK